VTDVHKKKKKEKFPKEKNIYYLGGDGLKSYHKD